MKAEIWVIPPERKVLVTEFPGPPASICGYVSEQARKAAQARGCVTVSEIGFPKELFFGSFETPEVGWGEAGEIARAKAAELGYRVEYDAGLSCPDPADEDEELFDDDEELFEDDDDWDEEEDE